MKIAIVGHTGRVGKELLTLIQNSEHICTAGWDSHGPKMLESYNNDNNELSWDADQIDIVIDFSLHENFPKILSWCQSNSKPLVSGVTGLGEITDQKLKEIMGADFKLRSPFFWSSNMSLGIALVKMFIKMSHIFGPKEFSISETHHIHKKDSPSGTALSLAHSIEKEFNLKKNIPIEAIRAEEVFGIHEVTFRSDEEEIKIYHEAKNRKVFASGALKVSEWLGSKTKAPKLYFMEDYIKDVKNS